MLDKIVSGNYNKALINNGVFEIVTPAEKGEVLQVFNTDIIMREAWEHISQVAGGNHLTSVAKKDSIAIYLTYRGIKLMEITPQKTVMLNSRGELQRNPSSPITKELLNYAIDNGRFTYLIDEIQDELTQAVLNYDTDKIMTCLNKIDFDRHLVASYALMAKLLYSEKISGNSVMEELLLSNGEDTMLIKDIINFYSTKWEPNIQLVQDIISTKKNSRLNLTLEQRATYHYINSTNNVQTKSDDIIISSTEEARKYLTHLASLVDKLLKSDLPKTKCIYTITSDFNAICQGLMRGNDFESAKHQINNLELNNLTKVLKEIKGFEEAIKWYL